VTKNDEKNKKELPVTVRKFEPGLNGVKAEVLKFLVDLLKRRESDA